MNEVIKQYINYMPVAKINMRWKFFLNSRIIDCYEAISKKTSLSNIDFITEE